MTSCDQSDVDKLEINDSALEQSIQESGWYGGDDKIPE